MSEPPVREDPRLRSWYLELQTEGERHEIEAAILPDGRWSIAYAPPGGWRLELFDIDAAMLLQALDAATPSLPSWRARARGAGEGAALAWRWTREIADMRWRLETSAQPGRGLRLRFATPDRPAIVLQVEEALTLRVALIALRADAALIPKEAQATQVDAPAAAPSVRPPRAGAPWDAEADAALAASWKAGEAVRAIAVALERSEGAIRARLLRLGLTDDGTFGARQDKGTGHPADAAQSKTG